MTIYIVTGPGPRCGSTMMMRALEAGGLELVFDPACDEAADRQASDDYHPAPDGICELPMDVQLADGFPGPEYDGKAIKVWVPSWGPLTHLVAGDYKVVWIARQAESRWQSLWRFHSKVPLVMMTDGSFYEVARLKDMAAETGLLTIRARLDFDVVELDYEAVLERPLRAFELLVERGWAVDPVKASKVVDPDRRRF